MISDFEVDTIQAMHDTFPAAVPTGCLFHFTQAVFKKWRSLGLEQLYADDDEHGEAARNSFRSAFGGAFGTGDEFKRFTFVGWCWHLL